MNAILKLFDLALVAVIFFALLMTARFLGPDAEARFWPAVEPLRIMKTEAVDESHTRIWVEFRKNRECPPIGVFWYRGPRGGPFERIEWLVEKPGGVAPFVNRPLGLQRSGPWLLNVPASEIEKGVFSDAQHDCNPLWPTVSRFYN